LGDFPSSRAYCQGIYYRFGSGEKFYLEVIKTVEKKIEKKVSVTEAVKNIEKEPDALAGELKSKKKSTF